ncbi:MAG: hypothetical protein WAO78_18685 [Roseovarius sp.]
MTNQGMHPYLMGNFPVAHEPHETQTTSRKPYLAR